ncbi:MAG: Asp-tRNA(Asn)/Glu-tRNA(Gln) amidotransferase subunit GatC [Myxococcota bacterium]|nr:Asp-tRNA(Asn)/Glu-tRNA(Gln) amidotransferase subunit GatC [Myxococcota bacterium]
MSSIDRHTVRHIASLARLQFSPEDEERLAVELARIVDYVHVLEELEVPAESGSSSRATPLREDAVTNRSRVEEMLATAPDRQDFALRVPAVMKDKG